MKKYNTFFCLLISLVVFYACETKKNHIEEGIITYDAHIVDMSNVLANYAPTSMTVKFKPDNYVMEMGKFGLFSTTFIVDGKKKQISHLLQVFGSKNACIENEADILDEIKNYKLNFEFIEDSTINIAGYTCKLAVATKLANKTEKFNVWYTEEINVQRSNFLNPYSQIKGMLMEYRLEKFGIEMIFRAQDITEVKNSEEIFNIPNDYKIISVNEMEEFIKSLQ